jgi:D-tagatose-1,6-bisphosphate aldolase subunit GatZ/KbaZ
MYLDEVIAAQHRGQALGIPSICTAHPDPIKVAMRLAQTYGVPALIEATCNQVNQFGGYTGLKPADFVSWIRGLAEECGFPQTDLILGGDHLGPSVWQGESSTSAMQKARELVREYVRAGFTKIHLDCSMRLGNDGPAGLLAAVVAERAAELAQIAEQNSQGELRYVIGSEVPIPGGAISAEEPARVTLVESVKETIALHHHAFRRHALDSAWERVIAIVVQPGVEFGDDFILEYDPGKAEGLKRLIEDLPMVFEAHSTDYQRPQSLGNLVRDHFAILKVGPALTFAYREAVFALARLEDELYPATERSNLIEVIDRAMLRDPKYWQKYYGGSAAEQASKRRYSRSDRIRYYWAQPEVQASVQQLMTNLREREIRPEVLSQRGLGEVQSLKAGGLHADAASVISESIASRLQPYFEACRLRPVAA